MNFVETFQQGKAGKIFGLTTGIDALDKAINGIQRKTSIGLVAAPKVGKTTLCDYSFLISPYLQCEKLGILDNVEWIYYSYEIDRISKEFKVASFFMYHDYDIFSYMYKGVEYQMDQDYLMGRKLHQDPITKAFELIKVSEEHEEMLKAIYLKRIIPIFGEYAVDGTQIRKGKVQFIEDPENPTGINKYLMHYAEKNGKFVKQPYHTFDDNKKPVVRERIIGYTPHNPDKFTIVIMDHVRKLRRERGFTLKENIDKWLEYSTFLRNICSYTFINICHSNRQLANVDRLKYAGEYIFPTADDVKDTGNIAEESTILMTMFNPNDEKYNLKSHFDVNLESYPDYRSIHITESRYTECPAHIQTSMYGGVNLFTPLNRMQ